MFGRNSDDNADSNDQSHLAPTAGPAEPAAAAPPVDHGFSGNALDSGFIATPTTAAAGPAPDASSTALGAPVDDLLTDQPLPSATTAPDAPTAPVPDILEGHEETVPAAADAPEPVSSPVPDIITPSSSTPTKIPVSEPGGDLEAIKQKALQQLSPLVGHLELTPEEKFHTTMMMLQATDDQNLVKDVYKAATDIPDEKLRAQALLDVVNEINYFSQHKEN